jgi:uncharacterized protein (TIGR00255 family)
MAELMSMTGYGSAQVEGFNVEIKTVNHRFIELSLRLPAGVEASESSIQSLIRQSIRRGRCDVTISKSKETQGALDLQFDQQLFDKATAALLPALQGRFSNQEKLAEVVVSEVLRRPEILRFDSSGAGVSEEALLSGISSALTQVLAMRVREGENLKRVLLENLQKLEEFRTATIPLVRESIEKFRTRVTERLAQLQLPLEKERLATEVALMADRTDVSEEIDRLGSHISQFRALVEQGGEVGKRLDFLTQEMGREINTTGSKSQYSQISSRVVEAKAILEKIREQVQNIE